MFNLKFSANHTPLKHKCLIKIINQNEPLTFSTHWSLEYHTLFLYLFLRKAPLRFMFLTATSIAGVTNKIFKFPWIKMGKNLEFHLKRVMYLNSISSRRWMSWMNIIGWDNWLKNTDECFVKARRTGAMALQGFWALENSEQRSFRALFIEGNAAHASRSVFYSTCTMRCYLRFQKKSSNKFYFWELRNISSVCEDKTSNSRAQSRSLNWRNVTLSGFFLSLSIPSLHCYVDKILRGNRASLCQWEWFLSN